MCRAGHGLSLLLLMALVNPWLKSLNLTYKSINYMTLLKVSTFTCLYYWKCLKLLRRLWIYFYVYLSWEGRWWNLAILMWTFSLQYLTIFFSIIFVNTRSIYFLCICSVSLSRVLWPVQCLYDINLHITVCKLIKLWTWKLKNTKPVYCKNQNLNVAI